MWTLSKSEVAFCFLNIAALISIILYARHHIHSDTYEVHTKGKHAMLQDFVSQIKVPSPIGLSLHNEESKEQIKKSIQTTRSQTKEELHLSNHHEMDSSHENKIDSEEAEEIYGHQCEQFMYWKHLFDQNEQKWESPWKKDRSDQRVQYITFEPDHGGWNNVRMAMETVAALAYMSGRTLVMPPQEAMYLISKGNTRHGFGDFFPLEDLDEVDVISMATFLQREKAAGHVLPRSLSSGKGLPSQEELDHKNELRKAVWSYLRDPANTYCPLWKPADAGLIFPSSPDSSLDADLKQPSLRKVIKTFQANRKGVYEYSLNMSSQRIIHLASDAKTHKRLLTHFYLFLFMVDPVAQRANLRFIRKRFHYREQIFCAASRGILQLQKEEEEGRRIHKQDEKKRIGRTPGDRGYSSMHIRRGDFQYKQVKMECTDILNATRDLFLPGELIYISTDESDKSFFQPFLDAGFRLKFLDNVVGSVGSLPDPNFVGMVEQIIATQGRVFVGTWYSTFTGYINRMRGYYGLKPESSYYFWGPKKYQMRDEGLFPKKFSSSYAREWPMAWTDIDH